MSTLASLQKSTRNGMSIWTFDVSDNGLYSSSSSNGKNFMFSDIDKMRSFYKTMISYGFRPSPVEITE